MRGAPLVCQIGWLLALGALAGCDVDHMSGPHEHGAGQEGDGKSILTEPRPVFAAPPGIAPKVIITPRAPNAPATCGDGVVGAGEACDPGSDGCCSADCSAALPAGAVCRAAGGACDVEEVCDGSAFACPGDTLLGAEVECRASTGVCDAAERCDGVNKGCADNAMLGTSTLCRAAQDACDAPEYCTGAEQTCPPDAVSPTTSVCRPAADGRLCDAPEYCDGVGMACPPDLPYPRDHVCRTTQGRCDEFAVCDGTSMECPPVVASLAPAGAICREPAAACDAPEVCDGQSTQCPDDRAAAAGTLCRPVAEADVCDIAEQCDGQGMQCPADAVLSANSVCRPVEPGELCDVAEYCSGTSADKRCPTDRFVAAGEVCRTADGACDVAESCTGSDPSCPSDAFDATRTCRPAAGMCDQLETCSGSSPDCPPDVRRPASVVCRAAAGACDAAESCDGGIDCPADARSSAVCRASAGVCDPAERCSGGVDCPPDARSRAVCRPALHPVCDVVETCDGQSVNCPADRRASSTTQCRAPSAGSECDAAEYCANGNCPVANSTPLPDGDACNITAENSCWLGVCCPGATQNLRGQGCEIDRHKIVFVTSAAFDAVFAATTPASLDAADAECTALARAANLAGSYSAWLSNNGNGPHATARVSAGPYARVDGMIVAASLSELVNTDDLNPLRVAINLDERGRTRNTTVWTGTAKSGFLTGSACGGWTSTTDQRGGTYGSSANTDQYWTYITTTPPPPCTGTRALYCFQD